MKILLSDQNVTKQLTTIVLSPNISVRLWVFKDSVEIILVLEIGTKKINSSKEKGVFVILICLTTFVPFKFCKLHVT